MGSLRFGNIIRFVFIESDFINTDVQQLCSARWAVFIIMASVIINHYGSFSDIKSRNLTVSLLN